MQHGYIITGMINPHSAGAAGMSSKQQSAHAETSYNNHSGRLIWQLPYLGLFSFKMLCSARSNASTSREKHNEISSWTGSTQTQVRRLRRELRALLLIRCQGQRTWIINNPITYSSEYTNINQVSGDYLGKAFRGEKVKKRKTLPNQLAGFHEPGNQSIPQDPNHFGIGNTLRSDLALNLPMAGISTARDWAVSLSSFSSTMVNHTKQLVRNSHNRVIISLKQTPPK